jgi:hypothetical protein
MWKAIWFGYYRLATRDHLAHFVERYLSEEELHEH